MQGGAQVNRADYTRGTPLIAASSRGHAAVVRILLQAGAQVEARCRGLTALFLAAEGGHTAAALALVDAGALVDSKRRNDGLTSLHMAAYKGHSAVVRILLERGAEVNGVIKPGLTPLHSASERGHEAVVVAALHGVRRVDSADDGGTGWSCGDYYGAFAGGGRGERGDA